MGCCLSGHKRERPEILLVPPPGGLARPLTLGPILGGVTETSARVFARGANAACRKGGGKGAPTESLECTGVLCVYRAGAPGPAQQVLLTPFPAENDFTGVFDVSGLTPGVSYEYTAYCVVWRKDGEGPEPGDVPAAPPSGGGRHQLRIAVPAGAKGGEGASFVFGSCRYVLRTCAKPVFDVKGDRTFQAIQKQVDDGMRTDAVLMLGDQIYADSLNKILPVEKLSEYRYTYRTAFATPGVRKLMAGTPTMMVADDHELWDNFALDEREGQEECYEAGIKAYNTYQKSHSPAGGRSENWYSFEAGGCHCFAMDTRLERIRTRAQLISPRQMEAVKEWLLACPPDTPKFLMSGVPMFPDFTAHALSSKVSYVSKNIGGILRAMVCAGKLPRLPRIAGDKWGEFPAQRDEILGHIAKNNIGRVVILSGDVHFSMRSSLRSMTRPEQKVTQLISSPFYFPGTEVGTPVEGSEARMGGEQWAVEHSELTGEDSFGRVTVLRGGAAIRFQVIDTEGAAIIDDDIELGCPTGPPPGGKKPY